MFHYKETINQGDRIPPAGRASRLWVRVIVVAVALGMYGLFFNPAGLGALG